MKMAQNLDSLNSMEKKLLLAIGFANDFSLKGHYPKETIRRSYSKEMRGGKRMTEKLIKKAWKSLKTKGLIMSHKTGGSETWQLTRDGQGLAVQLKNNQINEEN